MSKFGYDGPKLNRSFLPPAKEENAETLKNQERLERYISQKQKQNRFEKSGGPVFKKVAPPKQSFLHRFGGAIGGFMVASCVYFMIVLPILGAREYTKTPKQLLDTNPEETLQAELQKSYLSAHALPAPSYPKEV